MPNIINILKNIPNGLSALTFFAHNRGRTDTQGYYRALLKSQPTIVGAFSAGLAISNSIGVMVHNEES